MNVKIFSKNNCIQCKMAKRFLSENNIAFEEINIDAQCYRLVKRTRVPKRTGNHI